MVSILNKALQNKGEQKLAKFVDPFLTSPGRKPVVAREEEDMIVEHIVLAGSREFAVTHSDLKLIMSRIAQDGWLQGLENGFPCNQTIPSFRARRREVSLCAIEHKSQAKLKRESYEPVKILVDSWGKLRRRNVRFFLTLF